MLIAKLTILLRQYWYKSFISTPIMDNYCIFYWMSYRFIFFNQLNCKFSKSLVLFDIFQHFSDILQCSSNLFYKISDIDIGNDIYMKFQKEFLCPIYAYRAIGFPVNAICPRYFIHYMCVCVLQFRSHQMRLLMGK